MFLAIFLSKIPISVLNSPVAPDKFPVKISKTGPLT